MTAKQEDTDLALSQINREIMRLLGVRGELLNSLRKIDGILSRAMNDRDQILSEFCAANLEAHGCGRPK